MNATIRPYRAQDLGRVLRLWQQCEPVMAGDGLTVDQAVDLMSSDQAEALVAEGSTGDIVGVAVGESSVVVGWVHKLVVSPEAAAAGEVARRLLDELEHRLVDRGARKLAALVPDQAEARAEFEARGYQVATARVFLERQVPVTAAVADEVAELGGQKIAPGLWDSLKGMDEAKEIVERLVVLPLDRPDLASRHAVDPPNAILLFGPPGTGKTTFAKGLAGRLDWTFVEIQPGDLAADGPQRQARRLAETFDQVLRLPSAVVFVDEVEDLASVRHTERKVGPSVTNEFLKQIPRLRDRTHHLLVCATNAVSALDPAILRPGRFGYVLPVGPPGEAARTAIWRRYVADITDEEVDIDALVAASDRFTPADIEFAARKAAQAAFERDHFEDAAHRALTPDFLAAIAATRPTVTEAMAESFSSDARSFTRY